MLYHIENLYKIRQREKGYRLHIREFRINRGAKIALTGPSGCGKSTTLDILGLSLMPDLAQSFEFVVADTQNLDIMELWKSGMHDELTGLRLACLGYVLQSGDLLPYLTAGENMMFTACLGGTDKNEAKDTALGLARQLEIEHLWHAMPASLSVGERQRAAIVRALASQPEVILADEPTAALDPLHAQKVMDIFLDIVDQSGSTLILVTHNIEWARSGGLIEVPFVLEENEEGVTAIVDFNCADQDVKWQAKRNES